MFSTPHSQLPHHSFAAVALLTVAVLCVDRVSPLSGTVPFESNIYHAKSDETCFKVCDTSGALAHSGVNNLPPNKLTIYICTLIHTRKLQNSCDFGMSNFNESCILEIPLIGDRKIPVILIKVSARRREASTQAPPRATIKKPEKATFKSERPKNCYVCSQMVRGWQPYIFDPVNLGKREFWRLLSSGVGYSWRLATFYRRTPFCTADMASMPLARSARCLALSRIFW